MLALLLMLVHGGTDSHCEPETTGLDALITAPGIVLFGEQRHGTREVSQVIGSIVCQIAVQGLPFRVTLEATASNDPFFEQYLNSTGDKAAKRNLMEAPIWSEPPYYDGRGSQATLSLVERLRRMRKSKFDVGLHGLGRAQGDARDRDFVMASSAARLAQENPGAIVLGVMMSGHASNRVFEFNGAPYYPVGYHLGDLGVSSSTVSFHSLDPTAWKAAGRKPRIRRTNGNGADFVIEIGPLSNSPPARLTYDGKLLKSWHVGPTLVDANGPLPDG
ncbi:MAG: hypothetical protein AAFX94_11640 [Myxococcota bacterium]